MTSQNRPGHRRRRSCFDWGDEVAITRAIEAAVRERDAVDRGEFYDLWPLFGYLPPSSCADVERAVEAGLPRAVARQLAATRHAWRETADGGTPAIWTPDARDEILNPADELAGLFWAESDEAARHPDARLFDEVWLRAYWRARRLKAVP